MHIAPQFNPKRILQRIWLSIILGVLLVVGISLRRTAPTNAIPVNTVVSYYYDRSARLIRDGQFPKFDRWSSAPAVPRENAPPLLAYFTAAIYRPIAAASGMDFYRFAHLMPLLIFAVWLVVLFAAFRNLFGTSVAIAMAILFTFLPVSVTLTAYGTYFEEILGTLIAFLTVFALLKLTPPGEHRVRWMIAGSVSLTALILAWPQFPVFYAAAGVYLFLHLMRKPLRSPDTIRSWVIVLTAAFLAAELVTRLLGLAYTPTAMLSELAYGIRHFASEDLRTAMERSDWADLDSGSAYRYFSFIGFFLGALGFVRALSDYRDGRRLAIGTLGAVGAIAMAAFIKDRFLAFSFLLFVFALGLETLLAPEELVRRTAAGILALRRAGCAVFAGRPPRSLAIAALALAAILGVTYGTRQRPLAPPAPLITLSGFPSQAVIGEAQRLSLTLTNAGGPSLEQNGVAGGLHVVVENARVSDVRAASPHTRAQVSFKNFAAVGNRFFFEAKFDALDGGEAGSVQFTVTPSELPIAVYYRGWLPANCPRTERERVVEDLLPGWQDPDRAGWRSEACVKRIPVNDSQAHDSCPIPVLAAHRELQYFRCFAERGVSDTGDLQSASTAGEG